MKKLALTLAFVLASISFVSAQESGSWMGNGLSESRCHWMKITADVVETKDEENNSIIKEVWRECNEQNDSFCVHKFCNGLAQELEKTPGSGDTGMFWQKDMCNKYCITLQENLPIEGASIKSIAGDSGVDLLGNYFGMWYKIGALILGLICVLVIVVSGVQIIMGGASEEGVTSAKTRIWASLLSLILLFSSALILRTINPLFFT